MGLCFSCCKVSTKPDLSVDPFEADLNDALARSRHEDAIAREKRLKEDEELARVIQESSDVEESSHLRLREEEERLRARRLENDAQIAHAERQLHNRSAMDEEAKQLAKALEESIKEEGKRKQLEDEQVKRDAELALSLQESLNKLESPPRIDENNSIFHKVPLNEEEQLAKALEESLKVKGKGKKIEDEQVKKDDQVKKDAELALSLQESLNILESPPRIDDNNNSIFPKDPLNVDKQLAKALKKSLKDRKGKQIEDEQVKKDAELALMFQERLNPHTLEESNNISTSPVLDEDEQQIKRKILKEEGQMDHFRDEVDENGKLLEVNPPPSICGGCKSVVENEGSVNILGVLWHSGCFSCCACDKPIAIHNVGKHVSNSRGNFHKSCYERYCYVCKEKKMKACNWHPFWEERYCPAHETDGTPKCCSCERFEPQGATYVIHEDGRRLCLECMDTALMDSVECQPLHFDMRDFFEGLNMKIEKEFPFLLVEKQALNKAEKEEKIDQRYEAVTRGICLSEEQIVNSVSQRSIKGPNNKLIGMATELQRVVSKWEVTGVLILYGLPRLLTGYILAHEMMHAYLRLNGHRILENFLEEGLCQVLGHMWLESQTYASVADTTVDASSSAAPFSSSSSSSSSSSRTPAASASKKGEWSDFEKKLVGFCKHQIETDESPVYGRGFRVVNEMVTNSSLHETLKAIIGG